MSNELNPEIAAFARPRFYAKLSLGGLKMKRMDLVEGVFASMVGLNLLALIATVTAFVLG